MNFKNWFKGRTPLQLAIERGLRPGANLVAELDELDDYEIKSKGDAEAICAALEALEAGQVEQPKRGDSPLYAVTRLFNEVTADSDALEFLRENGIPRLVRLARRCFTESPAKPDDLLFILKILAAYGTKEGADLVLEIGTRGYAKGSYWWTTVMNAFTPAHPEARRVFTVFGNSLPDGFIAVTLLDAANRLFVDGGEALHPFDSDSGVARLEAWLRDDDPEHFSYARSATVALAFIGHPKQNGLFQIAFDHPDPNVQLEAAWAATKLEHPGALQKMVSLCKNVNYSSRAKRYLKELGHEAEIPEESTRPDFEAMAEFSEWLAHPNELGRFPDRLEILDHRDLRWPTDGEIKHLWLIQYRVKDTTGLANDDIGVGLVGSVTFCLFSYALEERPPEDSYAIHCYWEMSHKGRITDTNVEGTSDYDSLLQQWKGEKLEDAKIVAVTELSPDVGYPNALVALASAKRNGHAGWAVLDGQDGKWYAGDEMPNEHHSKTILMVHIGRRLLGFTHESDRKPFLKPAAPIPPEQIKSAYEKLLAEAQKGPLPRCMELISNHGLLGKHLNDYVEALCKLGGGSKATNLADVYEQLLCIARERGGKEKEVWDSWSATGANLDLYVTALEELERKSAIVPVVELFAPHWEHNLGYGKLGRAALKAGEDEVAERFFIKLRDNYDDWQRSEEMSRLAEIWHRKGKPNESRSLLVECMQKMLDESRTATDSDCALFEKFYQNHRETYLKIFPGEPLANHGLPETTRR